MSSSSQQQQQQHRRRRSTIGHNEGFVFLRDDELTDPTAAAAPASSDEALLDELLNANDTREGTPSGTNGRRGAHGAGFTSIDEIAERLKPEDLNPYAVLNLAHECTESEIRDAYKRLCRAFHPDKLGVRLRNDPEAMDVARSRLDEINWAYDILIDERKREAFDALGMDGVILIEKSGPIGSGDYSGGGGGSGHGGHPDDDGGHESGGGGGDATMADDAEDAHSDPNQPPPTVARRFRTVEEMKAEIDRISREQRMQQIDDMVRSRGAMTITVNAVRALHPPPLPLEYGVGGWAKHIHHRTNQIEVSQLHLKHSFETAVGTNSRLLVSPFITAGRGISSGNMWLTLKHSFPNRVELDLSTTLLYPRTGSFKVNWNPTLSSFVTAEGTLQSLDSPPHGTITLGRALYNNTSGYIAYRTGKWALGNWGLTNGMVDSSSLGVGLIGKRGARGEFSTELTTTAIGGQQVSFNYNHRVSPDIRAKSGVSLQVASASDPSGGIQLALGLTANWGADYRFGQHNRVGYSIEYGLDSGLLVRVRLVRMAQIINVPVILTPVPSAFLVALATIIPASVMSAVHYAYVVPKRRRELREKIEALREEHRVTLGRRKHSALAAVKILQHSAKKSKEAEEQRNGLVIREAYYGHMDSIQAKRKYILTSFNIGSSQSGTPSPPPQDDNEKQETVADADADADDDSGVSLLSRLAAQTRRETAAQVARAMGYFFSEPASSSALSNERQAEALAARELVDITVQTQALVQNSELIIAGNHSKSHLTGFYDPCFAERKQMLVLYEFHSRLHLVVVEDMATLACPLRAHIIH
ncbi:hypothetical protein GQ42DRAFT_161112 [Ramicandelaber brevisporus]|nr:hypothetical protein GQ42DRAFT_161112 [Ramicandelaber brevisporus]